MAAEGQGKECWVTHSQGFNRGRGREGGVNPELDKIAMFFLLRPPPFSFLPPLVSESIRTGKIVRSGGPPKNVFLLLEHKSVPPSRAEHVSNCQSRKELTNLALNSPSCELKPTIPHRMPREKFRHEDEGWGEGE